MNKGSLLSVVDLINAYVPKEYEIAFHASHIDIRSVWKSETRNFKLVHDKFNNHYALVNEKRMVDFNPELFTHCKELRHEIIISMLGDIGIDVLALKNVKLMSHEGDIIYVLSSRKSYGDVLVHDYTPNKELLFKNLPVTQYSTGMTYESRVNDLWIKL